MKRSRKAADAAPENTRRASGRSAGPSDLYGSKSDSTLFRFSESGQQVRRRVQTPPGSVLATLSVLLRLRNSTMLPDASRDRPNRSIVTAVVLSLALTVLPSGLFASPPAARVLLVVPPGAELAAIDRARSAVPPPQTPLLAAESSRVRLKGGLEIVVDFPFASAPAADLVVLLPGEAGPADEAFLVERKKTARALLLPPGSRLADRLPGAEGGALVVVGGPEAIPAVLEGIGAAPTVAASAPPPPPTAVLPTRAASPTPASTPTRGPTGRVFDRYFSGSRPTPTPR